jgi:NTP pyrophosphatase (non-canonical NTP hydrolase)
LAALEASRRSRRADPGPPHAQGQARPKGHTPAELAEKLADEIADVLCHALLLAEHHEVDLVAAIRRKWLSRVGPS